MSKAQLMMSAPDHFEVSYCINPWMDPAQWQLEAGQLQADARRGWAALKAQYEALGAEVWVQTAQPGLPDLVFTANAGVALNRTVVPARFAHPQRRGEEAHDRAFFHALMERGVLERLIEPPQDLVFEGAGDALWDRTRQLIWTGWGQRSSRAMAPFLAETLGVPTVDLQLVDPRFYHLDTCFCVLTHGEVIVHTAAFAPDSLALIESLVEPGQLILASEADAFHLAVNSVCIGNDVVLCYCSPSLRAALEARGYRVHVVGLDSFNRSGGAAYCLTLRLDQMSG